MSMKANIRSARSSPKCALGMQVLRVAVNRSLMHVGLSFDLAPLRNGEGMRIFAAIDSIWKAQGTRSLFCEGKDFWSPED